MAGLISQATIEQVRAANEIVEVIGSYIPLKRAGANFRALCPFHKEKTPSFNVNPQQQIFKCFGCGKGGNVFGFVMEYESIGFVDAVRRLAERAKIPIEVDNQPGQQQARHLKDVLLQIHEQITQRWQAALVNDAAGQVARDYLKKRGVSDEAVKQFRLGYAPELWDDTVNWARGKGFDLKVVEQAGLILRKEASDHLYDRFRGRLIFPICDEQGRVIGFSGRILSGDEKVAKYVNSPETPIFTKGKVFFGLDKSKRAMLDAQSAIVCEGQLDLIACFTAGVKNIVAPQGTALTADHARILKRYVEEVVLCFDADNAGQNAAVRSLDSLLQSGLAVRVATMPAGNDPDSFIKANGGPAFQKIIENAQGFFDYYLHRLCLTNDTATDKGRQAVVQAMAESVQKTGSDVLLDTYAQKTALRLGVATDAVRNEFKKHRPTQNVPSRDEPEIGEPFIEAGPPPSQQELWLLRLLLENDSFLDWISAQLHIDWLTHPNVREIVSVRLEAHRNHSWPGLAGWLSQIDNPTWQNLVTEIVADSRPIADPEKLLKGTPQKPGVVQLLRDKFLDRQMAALNQRLAKPDLSDEEKLRTLVTIQETRKLKQQSLST